MINWYIALYLGIILILYLYPNIAGFPPIKDYMEGNLGYGGLSRGTNLLLSRLVSGDLLAMAMISVISFGILGGLGFALMIFISLLIFTAIVYQLRKDKTSQSIPELLDEQTNRKSLVYHSVILLGVNFGNMILQLAALQYLLGSYFLQTGFVATFFVSIFSFAYAGLGGFDAVSKGARPQTFIIFLTTAIITISIFLENGLTSTYLDIVNMPIPSLHLPKAAITFLSGVVIITAQYCLDNSLWHSVFHLKPQRQYTVLMLTVFCVLGICLGYSAITVYGLTQGLGTNVTLIQVLEDNNAIILVNLHIIAIFVAVISSYATNLYSGTLIYLNLQRNEKPQSNTQKMRSVYIFAFLFNLFVLVIYWYWEPPFIGLLISLGSIYASLALPFFYTLFRPSRQRGLTDYIGIVPLIVGISLLFYTRMYFVPLLCLCLGIMIQAVCILLFKIKKILQKDSNIL